MNENMLNQEHNEDAENNISGAESAENNSENESAVSEANVPSEAENTAETETAETPSRKKKILKEIREWFVSLAVALLIVLVLRSFLFTIIRVDGTSMDPTLKDTERLFVTVYDVKFGEVERGDIVICHYPNRGYANFVKRVVAVPGDTVYRKDNVTHVVYSVETEKGTEIYDEAIDPKKAPSIYNPDYEYVLGEDEYFVVGDNTYNSHDSRDWNDLDSSRDVGPITKDMIIGHVRSVIWPLNSIRTVE